MTIKTSKDVSNNRFEHVCDAFSEQKDALNEIRSQLMDSPARASSSKEVLTNPDTLLPNSEIVFIRSQSEHVVLIVGYAFGRLIWDPQECRTYETVTGVPRET